MTFNWTDYFTLAERLTQVESGAPLSSASLRSAVSRAYYAAFNASKVFLIEREGCTFPKDGSIHRRVIAVFKHHENTEYKYLSEVLHRLRCLRNDADYSERLVLPGKTVRGSVAQAREVLNTLKNFGDQAQ
jgi:uncharacterized protein (UPF0332 family)